MFSEDEFLFSSLRTCWDEIKRKVQHVLSVSDVSYHLWLESLELVECRDNYVYIGCEKYDQRALEYLHKKFNLAFGAVIYEKFGKVVTVIFQLKDSYDLRGYDYLKHYKCDINPNNTFDSFIVGECNKYAYLCSLAVAEDPANTWNSLFIYGKTGLGKTHLLHSIGNYILKADSSKSVLYVTCKQYLEDVVDALRCDYKESLSDFKSKYLNADVLLIDDFQWIIGKEASLEEFFIMFDALREANKQIVLASDRSFKGYGDIPGRFISRIASGMTVDIQVLDPDTAYRIVKIVLKGKNPSLSEEIIKYISANHVHNVRELYGVMNKIEFLHSQNQEK